MTINFKLPDFTAMKKEIVTEIAERVVRRTPRSSLDKEHAQDNWEVDLDAGRIKNDTDYIIHLEHGTSKMAGFHMVATTMEELPDIVAQAFENATKNSN